MMYSYYNIYNHINREIRERKREREREIYFKIFLGKNVLYKNIYKYT